MAQMKSISSRMRDIVSTLLPAVDAKTAERASNKIDLATAEHWLIRPELVELYKTSISEHLDSEVLSYPQGFGGDPVLLQALAGFFNSYFSPKTTVFPEHIVATPGATSCLDALLTSICDDGDGVLVPAPFWSGFNFHFSLRPHANIVPVELPIPADITQQLESMNEDMSPCGLIDAMTKAYDQSPDPSRVRALVMTNPHNPFGMCYPANVLQACVDFCAARNLHYISDEVYALSLLPRRGSAQRTPFVSALSLDLTSLSEPKVHTIWSISKDLGSTGPRMAAFVSQSHTAGPLRASISLLSSQNLSTLTSLTTACLLTSPNFDDLVSLSVARLSIHHDIACAALRSWRIPFLRVEAGPFVFARLAHGAKSLAEEEQITQRLSDAGVLVTPGANFGGWGSWGDEGQVAGWVRITFAVPMAQLREGLDRIGEVLGFGNKATSVGHASGIRPPVYKSTSHKRRRIV